MIICSSMQNESSETVCRLSVESLNNSELLLIYQKRRNLETRNELIKRYVPVVKTLSEKYANREIACEDLCLVALRGLKNAIDHFDPERGLEFPGFVISAIISEIKKYVRDTGWYARSPQRDKELSAKIIAAKTHFKQKLNRKPTISDIATHLNCSEEVIIEAMEADWEKSPTPGERYKCEWSQQKGRKPEQASV